ncbi:hypothetical protein [Archaeoglobus veneficus]|uniref:Uncharacterized protein n=1 Tax=Archaeoglobus veneficus (strain DSM 11195 / SNP6) TaxID=693661 RepID=F2KR51_ARCVS|nr:hypothetical protein [Archaeoglobus veneficus]AEA46688.1 hypothetical protein Arcve_0668 [Archaeoglobus veneficus SNP6]
MLGGGYRAISNEFFCQNCKHFPELPEGGVCPKTGSWVGYGCGCYANGWRIRFKQLKPDEEVEIDWQNYFGVVQLDDRVYLVIAEPVYPFEPKEG